jgi:hypothetical protein
VAGWRLFVRVSGGFEHSLSRLVSVSEGYSLLKR